MDHSRLDCTRFYLLSRVVLRHRALQFLHCRQQKWCTAKPCLTSKNNRHSVGTLCITYIKWNFQCFSVSLSVCCSSLHCSSGLFPPLHVSSAKFDMLLLESLKTNSYRLSTFLCYSLKLKNNTNDCTAQALSGTSALTVITYEVFNFSKRLIMCNLFFTKLKQHKNKMPITLFSISNSVIYKV